MIKTSRLLKVRNWNHSVAHALHLLLTTDSLQKVPRVMAVLNKCKNIVNTLHFKGDVLEREVRNTNDQAAFSDLMDKVMDLTALVNAENLYSVDEENSSESAAALQRPLCPAAATSTYQRLLWWARKWNWFRNTPSRRKVTQMSDSATRWRRTYGVNQKEKMTIRFLSGAAIRASFLYCRSWQRHAES